MWLDIQIFGFRALWSPYFILSILAVALVYYLITGPYRHKFGGGEKVTGKQQIYFYTSLIVLYLVKGAPVDLLSHIMLTAHMAQLAILFLVYPILLIKGIPVWIWRKVIDAPIIKPIFALLSKPLIGLIVFNLLFSIYHMPAFFDFSKSSQPVHAMITIVILFAAIMMWWTVVGPIRGDDQIGRASCRERGCVEVGMVEVKRKRRIEE